MKITTLLLLAYMIWAPVNPVLSENTPQHKSVYEKQIEILLSDLQKITNVPAFSVSIVHKGTVVGEIASGRVGKNQQAKPNHIFRLASVSKIIGATMLADLVMDGTLNPDQPIGFYYPELDEKYHTITLRQLMAHISGMPHYQAKDYDIYDDHYPSAIAAVKTLKGRDLLSVPGEQYHYSSHAYTLAGAIYEKITGVPLHVSLPEYIKNLTGRSTPLIENITDLHPQSSRLFERSKSGLTHLSFGEKSYSVFGAGLSSTATDLALFGSAVLSKSQNSEKFKNLLFSPALTSSGKTVDTGRFKVGFGWRIGKDDFGRKIYHHAGATPGARSVLVIYPDLDLSIGFTSNASWVSSIEKTAAALADLYITGARSQGLNTSYYQANYQDKSFTGKIDCQDHSCRFMDTDSDLSKWFRRFNTTEEPMNGWPIHAYKTAQGLRLVMVTKIGFISLIETDRPNVFTGRIGQKRKLMVNIRH